MATTIKELEKVLKEHEKNMARMEIDAQSAMAEMQANIDRSMQNMLQKLLADQQQLFEKFQQGDRRTRTPRGEGEFGERDDREQGDYRCTRYGRLDFPKFDGTNVEGWVYKCNHFFVMDRTPDYMKLRVACVNLEDRALEWHQAFMQARDCSIDEIPWEEYVRSIVARFSKSTMEDAMEDLKKLQQAGDLQTYNDEFDRLLNKVKISESHVVSLYIGGLKPELNCMLKSFKPLTLRDAYYAAKQQLVVFSTLFPSGINKKSYGGGMDGYKSENLSKISGPTNAAKLPLLPTPTASTKITKKLSPKEVEAKRARGECFWCTEKFTPRHKCKNRQLFVIELEDDEECEEDMVDVPVPEVVIPADPHISIHALTGIPSYSIMKVVGSMGARTLHILVDSGSTHNFIDATLAKKLNCDLVNVPEMKVTVANGNQSKCAQLCSGFKWMM